MTEETIRELPPTEPIKASRRKRIGRTIAAVVAAILVLAVFAAGSYGLVTHPKFAATLRDLSIIALALVSIVIGLFLAILIFQMQSLIALLRDEIKPILESANQTVSTVRGTTSFLSDALVHPMIAAASYASAVRQTVRALAGGRRKKHAGKSSGGESGSA